MITLAALKDVTAQQVFDQVATHLLKQNQRSTAHGVCAYRGKGGLMCAAGCLIGEKEYCRSIECKNWSQLVRSGYAPEEFHDLILDLQDIHDAKHHEKWPRLLRNVAIKHGLNHDVIPSDV